MLNFIKKNILIVGFLCAVIAIAITIFIPGYATNDSSLTTDNITKEDIAIEFTLKDLQGNVLQLSDIKEEKIIINYWASWCAPCREEIPALNQAWTQLKENNIKMLAINYGEDKESVMGFLEKFPIDFTVLMDQDNIASEHMQITAMPTTLIVTNKGKVLDKILGPREWDSPEVIEYIKSL